MWIHELASWQHRLKAVVTGMTWTVCARSMSPCVFADVSHVICWFSFLTYVEISVSPAAVTLFLHLTAILSLPLIPVFLCSLSDQIKTYITCHLCNLTSDSFSFWWTLSPRPSGASMSLLLSTIISSVVSPGLLMNTSPAKSWLYRNTLFFLYVLPIWFGKPLCWLWTFATLSSIDPHRIDPSI